MGRRSKRRLLEGKRSGGGGAVAGSDVANHKAMFVR